jgi:multisubunit Na+/H+ antiporter MnhB subunit
MNRYLKIAYIGLSFILLYFIWEHLPSSEGQDQLLSRLMEFRFLGFVALMLLFFFIFLNFLGCRNKKDDKKCLKM